MAFLIQGNGGFGDAVEGYVASLRVYLSQSISQVTEGTGQPFIVADSGDGFKDRPL